MDALWGILIVGALLALYVLPSLIAAVRHVEMMLVILLLNLLLGWTGIGWLAALALAVLLPSIRGATQPVSASPTVPGSTLSPPVVRSEPVDFLIDPVRLAVFSLIGPVVFQYWWFWRFFKFARQERFPRSRSSWWILVPFYCYAVIGRLFHDLDSRLGSSRPAGFNPQAALALVVAANASGALGIRLGSLPLLVGGLALSCVFMAMALYQVQSAANAYLRITDPGATESGLFAGEAIALLGSLAVLGLLAVGTSQGPAQPTRRPIASMPGLTSLPSPIATARPTATATPAALNGVLTLLSQPGDYIGQGKSSTMAPPAFRFLAAQQNGPDTVVVTVETAQSGSAADFVRWTVWFAAPRGQSLRPGTYNNAERAAFRSGSASGLDVFGDGRGCNNVYGSFVIKTLVLDGQGNVQKLEASFIQHCENLSAPALQGSIRIGTPSDQQAANQRRGASV